VRLFAILLVVFAFAFLACSKETEITLQQKAPGGKTSEAQYEKELNEIRKSLKSDVKIKLKKDGKGAYTWEISGKDANEVLKANDLLRKKLGE
jgi:hypothetical protein